jgi:transposase
MRESMEIIYPRTAAERAMKLQEVLLRATSGKIKWWQAAELIGISERQMRRWRKRLEEQGPKGLLDRRRRKPSSRRVPKAQAEEVLSLYRDKYFDLNVRHFHEKLGEEHQIGLSYTWVKQALQAAGLVKRKARRGVHRKRRERRPLPGMMLHIDGSEHRWFQDERRHDLIVILDDATSEIYYAQLAEEETTATVMAGLRAVIEQKGLFCSLYSDRGAHFWYTPKSGGKVDYERPTQVGRAMKELGVHMIPSYSPQARGRSERNFPPGRDGCRRSCDYAGSERWTGPTRFSGSTTSPSSTAVLRFRQRSEARRLYPAGTGIWKWSSRNATSAPLIGTTPYAFTTW